MLPTLVRFLPSLVRCVQWSWVPSFFFFPTIRVFSQVQPASNTQRSHCLQFLLHPGEDPPSPLSALPGNGQRFQLFPGAEDGMTGGSGWGQQELGTFKLMELLCCRNRVRAGTGTVPRLAECSEGSLRPCAFTPGFQRGGHKCTGCSECSQHLRAN